MLLVYDIAAGCPAQDPIDVDVRNWLSPLGIISPRNVTGSQVKAETRERDGRTNLVLTAFRSLAVANYAVSSAKYTAQNPSEVHVLGTKIFVTSTSATTDTMLVGWNDGIPKLSSNAPSVSSLLVLRSGRLEVNGVTGTANIPHETEAYIEVVLGPSDGSVKVYVNDVLDIDTSDVTLNAVNEVAMLCGIPSSVLTLTMRTYFSDFYILDATGATFNSRLGPIEIVHLPLDSQEAAGFTPINAIDNITAVNKTDLDTASFNQSTSINDNPDLFKVDASGIDPDADILAVINHCYANKSNLGNRNLTLVATDGDATDKTPAGTLFTTYSKTAGQVLTKALDDSAWTIGKIEATQFGYEATE